MIIIKKLLLIASVVLGLTLLVLTYVYWTTQSGSLPSYFPGFIVNGTNIHFKHGLVSLFLAVALFAYAWFESGKRLAD